MPIIDLPGVRLYYERAGDGPPLLVVHGSGTDLRQPYGPLSWPLVEGFDAVAYDHRGLGRSEPIEPRRQPTMADFAADALALADAIGWDRFAVVGISFGGMVAAHLAAAAGDRVRRLVLACTSAGGAGGSSYPLHELTDLPAAEKVARHVAVIDTRTEHDEELAAMFRSIIEAREAPPTDGFRRQLEARRHHDAWDAAATITAPTLVAAGRYDGIAPLANAEALAGRIPGAQLRVFDGGHAFFMQDPIAFPVMRSFLLGEDAR